MALMGSVQKARPGLIGFDHSAAALNLAQARQFFNRGYRFCIRYISRTPELGRATRRMARPTSLKLKRKIFLARAWLLWPFSMLRRRAGFQQWALERPTERMRRLSHLKPD